MEKCQFPVKKQTPFSKMDLEEKKIAELKKHLDLLSIGKNHVFIQKNGQRIYTPIEDCSSLFPSSSSTLSPFCEPPKGAEIFVGNLPHDLFEDELLPVLERYGTVHTMRLMLDFFGRTRGYAFVAFTRVEAAYDACTALDGFRIRRRTRLAVSMSLDNRRLFVGNIPPTAPLSEIRAQLMGCVEGIVDVYVYPDAGDARLNRGFVFVEFESHRLAAIARRQLTPGNLTLWGKAIYVDWAEPLPTVSPEIMATVTKFYLSNLPVELNGDHLKIILDQLIYPIKMVKVHKTKNFAFVHFACRKDAELAMPKLDDLTIGVQSVQVEWARPINYSKKNRSSSLPNTLCRSVPPNMRKIVEKTVLFKDAMKKQDREEKIGYWKIEDISSQLNQIEI